MKARLYKFEMVTGDKLCLLRYEKDEPLHVNVRGGPLESAGNEFNPVELKVQCNLEHAARTAETSRVIKAQK